MEFPCPSGYFRNLRTPVELALDYRKTMPVERILVVDDEETIREIVSSMLTTAGYKCRQAASGTEALALLESGEEFELMLSDLMMANLDGIGLLERTKERFPEMPVVMVTAVHDISVALAAIRNGAYDYLLKPFEREQLLATARRALENRRLKLENRAYQTSLESLVAARTEQLQENPGRSGALLRHHPGSAGRCARPERCRDRRPLQARYSLHHCHCPRHGIVERPDCGDCPRRLPARHWQDGDSRRHPAQARQVDAGRNLIMREHCYHGYEILKKIPFLGEAAEIVYAHQERYDGTGYPRGLKGEQIPLGARISRWPTRSTPSPPTVPTVRLSP